MEQSPEAQTESQEGDVPSDPDEARESKAAGLPSDTDDSDDDAESFVVDSFCVDPSSLPAVLFGNVNPGRVQEHLAPFLLPVLADVVNAYAAYAFTSFGYPGFLLFIDGKQLVCLHDGEARIVPTPFFPYYIADQLDSDVGVWDMMDTMSSVIRFRRRYNWNGRLNDGSATMVAAGVSQLWRRDVYPFTESDSDEEDTVLFLNEDGRDILDGYEWAAENVVVQHGLVSVRGAKTLTMMKPMVPGLATTFALPAELRNSRLEACLGTNQCFVIARDQGSDPVLYQAPQGGTLTRVYEDDITVQLACLKYPYFGFAFRRTKSGCLWLEDDKACSLRNVRSILSNGCHLLIDHETLGYQMVTYTDDLTPLRSQLRNIAERA